MENTYMTNGSPYQQKDNGESLKIVYHIHKQLTNAPLRNSELIKVEGTKKEKERPKLTLEVIQKKKKTNIRRNNKK